MLKLIQSYEHVLKPSDLDNLLLLEEYFQKIDYDEHRTVASDIYAIENHDVVTQGNLLVKTYTEKCEDVIALMGIELIDVFETTLTEKQDLLGTLLEIEEPDNYDVVEEVFATHQGEASDELVCFLLEALSERSYSHYLFSIAKVEASLVTRIKKLIRIPEVLEEVNQTVSKIKKEYKTQTGDYVARLHEILITASVLPLGYKSTLEKLLGLLDEAKPKDIALEIHLFFIVTGTPINDRERLGNAIIEQYFEMNQQLRIEPVFNQLIKGLTNDEL